MATKVLPEARDDLRDALRYYRSVKLPALGRQLAGELMAAFREALDLVAAMPLGRPEHPDIRGARSVVLQRFPYMVFYTVADGDVFVVAVEYATRDYVARIAKRAAGGQ